VKIIQNNAVEVGIEKELRDEEKLESEDPQEPRSSANVGAVSSSGSRHERGRVPNSRASCLRDGSDVQPDW
jgi:hypothetical protein